MAQWHRDNFRELQNRVRNLTQREEYMEVVGWINKNAPADGNEEKYDHVTAILEQMSREPRPLPQLRIADKPFYQLTIDDCVVENSAEAVALANKSRFGLGVSLLTLWWDKAVGLWKRTVSTRDKGIRQCKNCVGEAESGERRAESGKR